MNEYIEFLKLIDLYSKLINLDYHIEKYKISCKVNEDSIIYNNLRKRLEKLENRKKDILSNKGVDSYIPILFEIIEKWDSLVKKDILLNIDKNKTLDKKGLPLYAIIQYILGETEEFKHIYKYLIDNNLYDPNHACGVSDEPFFSLLPKYTILDLNEYHKKVLTNPKTDFHILRNGMDMIEYALISLNTTWNIEEKLYWENYILWCLQGTCSVLDSDRFVFASQKFKHEYNPSIMSIFSSEYPATDKIKEYLLSDEGVQKQCENALYPSISRNEAIDLYLTKLNTDESIKKRLVNLKI